MVCKKCKKAFRKDVADMEAPDEADEYCPHCDNHFLREAVTRQGVVGLGGPATEDLRKDGRSYPFRFGFLIIELYGMIGLRGPGYNRNLKQLQIPLDD